MHLLCRDLRNRYRQCRHQDQIGTYLNRILPRTAESACKETDLFDL
jgi:hypothetical protein